MNQELSQARQDAANAAYQQYDFSDVAIESHDGWESTTPGTEMSRKVYFKPDLGEHIDCSETLSFTVRFASIDSAEVVEAYALTAKGDEVGFMPADNPAPTAM